MAIIHAGQGTVTPIHSEPDSARYSFEVYTEAKQRKPGLKISFLEIRVIYAGDTKLSTERAGLVTIWSLYKEPLVQHVLRNQQAVKCIVSFQMFDDGEYFAVARMFRESMRKGR